MNIGDNVKIKVRKLFSSKVVNGKIVDVNVFVGEDLFGTETEDIRYKIYLETEKIILILNGKSLFGKYELIK